VKNPSYSAKSACHIIQTDSEGKLQAVPGCWNQTIMGDVFLY